MRTIRNLLFSLTLQAVRRNNQGAPLLALVKLSIYIYIVYGKNHSTENDVDSKIIMFLESLFSRSLFTSIAKGLCVRF